MQYDSHPVKYDVNRVIELIVNLMLWHVRFNLPIPDIYSRNFALPITLNFYRVKKRYHVLIHDKAILLSKRQLECLQCIYEGLSMLDTAKTLGLSSRTVETYIEIIKNKLRCNNRMEIIKHLCQ